MAGNKMGEQTREKLIQAALSEFLKHGYEKTRVDDIAKRAGLTKAMIYYHFNSKENIISEITSRLILETRKAFEESIRLVDVSSPQALYPHVERMLEFFLDRKDLIRLLLIEYLKSNAQNIILPPLFTELIHTIVSSFEKGRKSPVTAETVLRLFFFNTVPITMYAGISEQWNHDLKIDPAASRRAFIESFRDTFLTTLSKSDESSKSPYGSVGGSPAM